MADTKCKADAPLHPNKNHSNITEGTDLHQQLFELVCLSTFYHNAVHAICMINETEDLPLGKHGQYGLFAFGQWIEERGETLITQFEDLSH